VNTEEFDSAETGKCDTAETEEVIAVEGSPGTDVVELSLELT
jgi:hypothetical protein